MNWFQLPRKMIYCINAKCTWEISTSDVSVWSKIQSAECTDCPKPSDWQSVPPLKLLSKNTRADLQLVTFQLHFDLISCCFPRLQHQTLHRAYWCTLKEVVYRCLILKSEKTKSAPFISCVYWEHFLGWGSRGGSMWMSCQGGAAFYRLSSYWDILRQIFILRIILSWDGTDRRLWTDDILKSK